MVTSLYDNETPYTDFEIEEIEKNIYKKQIINSNTKSAEVDIKKILLRDLDIFFDREYNLPQNIFVIKGYEDQIIVGRKIRSELRIQKKINAVNCSRVTSHMLLGILKTREKDETKIVIKYYPFTNKEKITVFNELKQNLKNDIYYPYKFRCLDTKKEKISPKTGWTFNEDKKEYLGYGEEHIRNYTRNFFNDYDLTNKVVYDPACSTGEFLYIFQKKFRYCKTIGHDLSSQMVDYAKDYVDKTFCCNAFDSPIEKESVDFMFLRFLNSEVLSTVMAYKIMNKLIEKVKKNGFIVCFGHTPVLIKNEWFVKKGLEVITSIGYDKSSDAIFQYYVLRRK